MLDFKNKKITIMGLGLHGGALALTKYLARQGAILTVTDLKNKKQLSKSLAKLKGFKINYVLGKHRLNDFTNADMIIKNPDIPRDSQYIKAAIKHNIVIENEASLFFKLCPAEITTVTGTRGKSTTTSLIHQIFRKHNSKALIAGNIQKVVMFDIINQVKKDTPLVLELSSWQLEGLKPFKLSPHIAAITNVMPDHLNRYASYEDYIEAKKIIFKYQDKSDYIILNRDNQITRKMGREVVSQRYWFSKKYFQDENGVFVKDNFILFRKNGQQIKICKINDLKLPGQHNLENYLAAVCAAKIKNIPNQPIVWVLKNYKGLENRLELIRDYQGIKFYNDTTATTPDATIAALKTLSETVSKDIVLLAGGSDKKLDFKSLAKEIKNKVRALILFEGLATEKLNKELKKINYNKTIVFVDSMPEAFKQAKYVLQKGDVFILSPAAASFGLFINEFDRGDQFKKQVAKYNLK